MPCSQRSVFIATTLISLMLVSLVFVAAPRKQKVLANVDGALSILNQKGFCLSDFNGDGKVQYKSPDLQRLTKKKCEEIGGSYRSLKKSGSATGQKFRVKSRALAPMSAGYSSNISSASSVSSALMSSSSSSSANSVMPVSSVSSSAVSSQTSSQSTQVYNALKAGSIIPSGLKLNIPGMGRSNYRDGNICHHMAENLRLAIEAQGYDGTFTAVGDYVQCKIQKKVLGLWVTIGNFAIVGQKHAITDIHYGGETIWLDPTLEDWKTPLDLSQDGNDTVNTISPSKLQNAAHPNGDGATAIIKGSLSSKEFEPYIDPEVVSGTSDDGKIKHTCKIMGVTYTVFDDRQSAMNTFGPQAFPEQIP